MTKYCTALRVKWTVHTNLNVRSYSTRVTNKVYLWQSCIYSLYIVSWCDRIRFQIRFVPNHTVRQSARQKRSHTNMRARRVHHKNKNILLDPSGSKEPLKNVSPEQGFSEANGCEWNFSPTRRAFRTLNCEAAVRSVCSIKLEGRKKTCLLWWRNMSTSRLACLTDVFL